MKSFLKTKKEKGLYRFFEVLPGFISWGTLILAIVLSFIKPLWIAIFIICFDVYWLCKAVYLSVYLINAYKKLKVNEKTNWLKKCQKRFPSFAKDIYHLIILPTYKEELDVIEPTFKALEKSNYPKDRMMVVFAIEERDKERGLANAKAIERKYGHKFDFFLVTCHPKDIIGEIAGKGSNETWAAKQAKKVIDLRKIPYENIIVSIFDIDTCVHPEYFGCLTYHFLENPKPLKSSYQPVPMYFNNIWDSPALIRVAAFSTTFWMMMEQVAMPDKLYTFSSHSMSFKTLVDIGFWETDVVSEDSRIFWQCFLHHKGDYRTIPLLIPVYMDTVLAKSYFKSLVNQYKQQRRWAWGVENIPYLIHHFLKDRSISFFKKAIHLFRVAEGFYSWALASLIIFLFGWFPILAGGQVFKTTVLAQNLPFVTQALMSLAMIGMIVSASLSLMLLPKPPKKYRKSKIIFMAIQWVLLPLTTIFLGSLPALDSQTRLMLGKYMGFWVTEKARKHIA